MGWRVSVLCVGPLEFRLGELRVLLFAFSVFTGVASYSSFSDVFVRLYDKFPDPLCHCDTLYDANCMMPCSSNMTALTVVVVGALSAQPFKLRTCIYDNRQRYRKSQHILSAIEY
jgi:hypothetical protein